MAEEFGWLKDYARLRNFVDREDPERTFSFSGEKRREFEELRDAFRRRFVKDTLGDELKTAARWIGLFRREVGAVSKLLDVDSVRFSREFNSFIRDPVEHLMKKVTYYLYDLLRDKISLEEYISSATSAVKTSLKTNLRTLYQSWVYVALLGELAQRGGRMVYPEVRVLELGRSGKQTTGTIPPNSIIRLPGRGYLSFFLEAPRPIAWEDSIDLKRIWDLYVTLRPDMLVYSGKVLNIVELGKNPPVKRPNVIVECKELEDWYKRVREVRGPFARPLSVEEWRSKWIEGLWDGLADIIGVKRQKNGSSSAKRKRAVRMRDTQIVALYRTLFQPEAMYLVSRTKVPAEVRRELEEKGIIVFDGVGFRRRAIRELADEIASFAEGDEPAGGVVEVDAEIESMLAEIEELLGVDRRTALREAVRIALNVLRNKSRGPRLSSEP